MMLYVICNATEKQQQKHSKIYKEILYSTSFKYFISAAVRFTKKSLDFKNIWPFLKEILEGKKISQSAGLEPALPEGN